MTEYRETGYDPDGYPPRDGGDPGGGGTVYGGARHTRDEQSPSGQEDGGADSTYGDATSSRGRARAVWRPTRGPRAEEAARRGDPAYGAPERGWRTSDGGYKSPDGGWRAPYRPYDTGEWRRDQRPDEGPDGTGETAPYSAAGGRPAGGGPTGRGPSGTGDLVRYRPPVGGAATDRRGYPPAPPGAPVSGYPPAAPGAPASGVPRPPASGVPRPPASGIPRYPASGVPRQQDDAPRYQDDPTGPGRYQGGSDVVPYRGGPAGAHRGGPPETNRGGPPEMYGGGPPGAAPRYPRPPADPGRGPRRAAGPERYPDARGTGEVERYVPPGPRNTGEVARYSAVPGPRAPEMPRYPAEDEDRGRAFNTDGTGRVARPGRAAAGPASGETTRIPRPPTPPAPGGYPAGPPKRRDDSPDLYTYDPLTMGGGESPAMRYDPATESWGNDPAVGEPAVPRSAMPDQRRPPGGADPRARGPRPPEAEMYSAPPRPVEWAPPAGGQEYAARRPPQRFEGTYPERTARTPRNVVPARAPVADEDDVEESPGYLHTALVTTAWYTIPLLLYTMYVLTLDGAASAGDGQSARENALNGLLGGMPRVGVALVTSLAVALLIRAISRGWRAATIGFAAAVVGAGAATVIFAALQG